MEQLNKDLSSGTFKQIYLLYGEEAYLKKRFRDSLASAILPSDDGMNMTRFSEKIHDVTLLIQACDTLPFFADRRLVVVENSGLFQNAGGAGEKFLGYLKELPSTTYLIFVEENVKKTVKLYKEISGRGYCAELSVPNERTLCTWLRREAGAAGVSIGADEALYMIRQVGTDMTRLQTELEKAACYCMEQKKITVEDIDAVCTIHISNHIFDMMEDMAYGRTTAALERYDELVRLRESPIYILSVLISQFRAFRQVYTGLREGGSSSSMARIMKMNEYRVKKLIGWTKIYGRRETMAVLERLALAEQQIKRGLIKDSLAVELFIIEHSSRNKI